MSKLRIAADLSLPPDAVTQAIGILAKRRAGKSYTARRFAEQLFRAGQQVVIVDPKGDWWGIRSSSDGKSPGLPIVILGGERGDVPLEVNSGEIVAKLVTQERVSVLLDLSLFRKREINIFMTAFLENLYRIKAREAFRTPLMLFIDEADAIAPQKPQEEQARMLGAAEDIVRRGGQRGIGCTLITQRSAVLNKNVLTQVEMIVALRTIAPQDLKALDAWIEVHGEREQRDTLMASLPALPVGDAWFWSPGWPTSDGIFQRAHVLPIETFDSGATPKSGERRVEPKNLADVDLDSLTRQMAATIERAKAEDPKELKKKIAERDREIAQLKKAPPASRTVEKPVVDQAAIDRAVKAALSSIYARVRSEATHVRRSLARINAMAHETVDLLDPAIARLDTSFIEAQGLNGAEPVGNAAVRKDDRTRAIARRPTADAPAPRKQSPSSDSVGLGKGERRILTAIAQYPDGAARDQLTVLTGYKRSTRDAYIQRLVGAGAVEVNGSLVLATRAGIEALGSDYELLPEGEALQEYWLNRLSKGERQLLEALLFAYPEGVARDVLSEMTGYKRSTRDAYIQRMKSRRLVEDAGRAEVRASENLLRELSHEAR